VTNDSATPDPSTAAVGPDYRRLSLWFDQLQVSGVDSLTPRPPLTTNTNADVCIVGAGFTGLWTAYYLAKAHPELSIVVLEKNIAGFGASGRNGGWCSAFFPLSSSALNARYGREATVALRQAMIDSVDEVGRVAETEGIDCGFVKGGTVAFVRDRPQLASARAELAEAAEFGVDELTLYGTPTIRSHFAGAAAAAATFNADCARIQPAALVRGLARVVERMGVRIYEGTTVTEWSGGRVDARVGGTPVAVRTGAVVVALEGYGSELPQIARQILPLYSLMIATEPLPESFWERAGIEHGQTFTDFRHLLIYGQRTADNRFAFGGRGARYHWGSAIRPGYDRVNRVAKHLKKALVDLFPDAANARVTHRWGGPLGVPRDWHAAVTFDQDAHIGRAGGYVGDGVSTTNLAGRTLADLVTGTASSLTTLPWVGHQSPNWEPEPLRFAGANAALLGTNLADLEQRVTRRPSLAAKLIAPLTGH
jgi:glycine/D-amino acid oxidase-like deaminating enzyme